MVSQIKYMLFIIHPVLSVIEIQVLFNKIGKLKVALRL